jgi:hypothetical protein
MDIQESENQKIQLEKDIINIKSQLEEANYQYLVHGKSANYKWIKSAKYALEMKKLELKEINIKFQNEKQRLKEEGKTKRTQLVERTFMDIAKKHISRELYFKILSEAMEQHRIPTNKRCEVCESLITETKGNRKYRYCSIENRKRITVNDFKLSPNWCPLNNKN